LLVTLLAMAFLREIPAGRQWAGVGINLIGIFIYFLPLSHENSQLWGLLVVVIGLAANAATTLLGRKVNREKLADPITVTGVSIGIGSIFLLGGGMAFQGLPEISLTGWMIILFMALVNTALAFTLWNYTQQTLRAMESSMLNGFMLVFIAIFAWIFIGESLSIKSIIGMVIAIIGGILVQLPKKSGNIPPPNDQSS
jgi:drug/metabolite transporter (DMT)-like permease